MVCLTHTRVLLLLSAAALLTFAGSMHNGFLIDDHAYFTGDKVQVKSLAYYLIPDKHRMLNVDSQAVESSYFYRPLGLFVQVLSYEVFGNYVFGYHIVSLIGWVTAAFLVYLFLLYLSGQAVPALWTALLFMIHPINGIAVNYISASIFSLMVIFMIASCFCCSLACNPLNPRRLTDFFLRILSVIFFYLALMCHETAVATPIYATAALYFGRKQNGKQAFGNSLWLWLALVPYCFFRLRVHDVSSDLMHNISLLKISPFGYAASLMHTWVWDLSRLVYPDGIFLMRAEPAVRGVAALGWFLVLVFAAAFSLWILRRYRRDKPMVAMGLAWVWIGLITFIPAASAMSLFGLLIEPHWFMFADIGFFMILAWCITRQVFLAVLASVWILTAWAYDRVWGNEILYCRLWLAYNPQLKAPRYFLGQAYLLRRDYPRAIFYLKNSLFNYYPDWSVYLSLGLVQAIIGHYQEAEQSCLNALHWQPRSAKVLNLLAKVYLKEFKFQQAEVYLERDYEVEPHNLEVVLRLAALYAYLSERSKAMNMYGIANQLANCSPEVTRPWLGYAIGSYDIEGMLQPARFVSQCSSDPESLSMAGSILGQYDLKQEAVFALQRAMSINPQYRQAYVEMEKLR